MLRHSSPASSGQPRSSPGCLLCSSSKPCPGLSHSRGASAMLDTTSSSSCEDPSDLLLCSSPDPILGRHLTVQGISSSCMWQVTHFPQGRPASSAECQPWALFVLLENSEAIFPLSLSEGLLQVFLGETWVGWVILTLSQGVVSLPVLLPVGCSHPSAGPQ